MDFRKSVVSSVLAAGIICVSSGAQAELLCSYFDSILICSDVDWDKFGKSSTEQKAEDAVLRTRTNVVTGLVTKDIIPMIQPKAASLTSQALGADIFYDSWEDYDEDGETYGINPSYTFGDIHSLTVTLPVHSSNSDYYGDHTTVGVDALYKFKLGENFGVGAHANYLSAMGSGDADDSETFSGGAFVSYLWNITDALRLSTGLLVDYTSPDIKDEYVQLVPGVNLGFAITDNWAVNAFFVGYYEIDAEDSEDDFYGDTGLEVSYTKGIWSVNLGGKTVVDLEDYESYEIYLGTSWRFGAN